MDGYSILRSYINSGVKYRTCDGDVVYMTRTIWSIMTYLEKLYILIWKNYI
jgi:hypothetical protein